MKSILVDFKGSKNAIFKIWEALDFDSLLNFKLENVKNIHNKNLELLKYVKWVLGLQNDQN